MSENLPAGDQSSDELSRNDSGEQREASTRPFVGGWVGLILIGLGVLFLIQNLTGQFLFRNWWAVFILLPGLAAFGNAWRVYQQRGRLTGEARGSIMGGLFFTLVAAIFILELDWGRVWPVFLILAGVGALFGSLRR